MAVVLVHEFGWILDEQQLYNQWYEKIGYRIQSALYEIDEPFRMDSQVEAMNKRQQNSASPSSSSQPPASKRKRKRRSSQCDLDQSIHHLQCNFQTLIDIGRSSGYFDAIQSSDTPLRNNRKAREAAKMAEINGRLPDIRQSDSESNTRLELMRGCSYGTSEFTSRICVNDRPNPITIDLKDVQRTVLVPEKCQFIWGSVELGLERLLENGYKNTFDLVILDPPWKNKAVERQKTYACQDETDFQDLPIPNLLKPGGLVAIWITNHPQYHDFVMDILLPRWDLVYEARWFWMKVTKSGEPICEYKKNFKMPFESLVFARRPNSSIVQNRLPDPELIISIPCAVPSRKPPLLDIVKEVLHMDSMRCLELYARYLTPNTVSIGDEVLKFQSHAYFDEIRKQI